MDKDRIVICKIISEMLDNPDKHGIYPTSTAYTRLEHYIEGVRDEFKEALRWCSGSVDFGLGGKAHEGWIKMCEPLLK